MYSKTSTNIKPIDKEAVHRICSGQVVLNLATAVKELVENSLDAGSTVIDVRLREYGSELIEVTDNGCGVEPENFQGLTLKHHTSKLQDFSDLVTVETFGFRGEALSSLCALSNLTVVTRHCSSDCGSRLAFDHNGKITSCTSLARQVGTTVSLENIFSTLPVRQKEFQRNLKREFGKMTQLLYAYCLVSTGVRISCTNQTKKGGRMTVVSTQGCKTVRENIACVFGTKQLSSLMEVKTVSPSSEALEQLNIKDVDVNKSICQLEGLVSSCAHGSGRSTADRQFYYVNSRPCEPSKVMKAVNEVYRQFNMHQQPFVFLNICSARDSVDVNVTPDKRQVFMEHEKLLVATIKASLHALFDNIPSTYAVNNIPSSTLRSPVTPSSPSGISSSSPLALFSQWQSNKRPNSDKQAERIPKQAKLDLMFMKKEKTVAVLNRFSKDFSLAKEQDSKSLNQHSGYSEDETSNIKVEDKPIQNVAENSVHSEDKLSKIQVEDKPIQICSESKYNLEENCEKNVDLHHQSLTVQIGNGDSKGNISGSEVNTNSNKFCNEIKVKEDEVFSDKKELRDSLSQQSSFSDLRTPGDVVSLSSQTSSLSDFTEDSDGSKPQLVNDESTKNKSTDQSTNFLQPEDNSVCSKSQEDQTSSSQVSVEFDTDFENNTLDRSSVEVNITMADLREFMQNSSEKKISDEAKVRFRAIIDPTRNKQAEQELNREISKDMFAKMEVIGQFNLGFIIARLNSDLFIVDQHATDEKYNFETLQKTTTISNQKLVVPQQLELTAVNEAVLMENLNVFKINGFEFTIDETAPTTSKVKLTSIPISLNWTFGKEDIDELLFMLQDAPNTVCRPSRVRAMFASRACRKSVMIGTALSKADMKRLLVHMGEIEQPWNCPHGRPTMRHLINLDFL